MARKQPPRIRDAFHHVTINYHDGKAHLGTDAAKLAFTDALMRISLALGNVLAGFALMSNHVHAVFFIPARPKCVTDRELLEASALMRGENSDAHREFLRCMSDSSLRPEARRQAFARRNDLSELIKTVNERFGTFINRVTVSTGRTIDDRAHRSVLSPEAVRAVLLYDCLNPARAGMETVPGQYPFTIYALAKRGYACALECIHRIMGGADHRDSLRRFELDLAQEGQRVIPGKRALTPEEALVLIEDRNDCAVTHPLSDNPRLGQPICPPPVRPKPKGTSPSATGPVTPATEGLGDTTPTLHDYLERGEFIGPREFVLEQAAKHWGKANPKRLVLIDEAAGLYAYSKPRPERIARQRLAEAKADALAQLAAEAEERRFRESAYEARRKNREERKEAKRERRQAELASGAGPACTGSPPAGGPARGAPAEPTPRQTEPDPDASGGDESADDTSDADGYEDDLAGAVTARQVFVWSQAQEAFFQGRAYDPADLPPVLALIIPYAWRRSPRRGHALEFRGKALDRPLLAHMKRRAA